MSKYSKSIAAFVGLAAIVSKEFFGVEIGQEKVDQIINGVLAVGTVYAVYRVPNKQ